MYFGFIYNDNQNLESQTQVWAYEKTTWLKDGIRKENMDESE